MSKIKMSLFVANETDNLELIHFDELTDETRPYRGLIREKSTDPDADDQDPDAAAKQTVVAEGIPCPDDIIATDVDRVDQTLNEDDDILCRLSYEGTKIRLFAYEGEWYCTTARKMNAFDSRWGQRESFGDLFAEYIQYDLLNYCDDRDTSWTINNLPLHFTEDDVSYHIVQQLCSYLNPNRKYVFQILSTPQNRVACTNKDNPYRVILLSKHQKNSDEHPIINRVTKPVEIPTPRTGKEMRDIIMEMGYTNTRGVELIKSGGEYGYQGILNVFHPEWKRISSIRNNEGNISMVYLKNRSNPENLEFIRTVYPEKKAVFDRCDRVMDLTVESLFNHYQDRFILKKYITVIPADNFVIKRCHRLACTANVDVDYSLVRFILDQQDFRFFMNSYSQRNRALKAVENAKAKPVESLVNNFTKLGSWGDEE